VSASWLLTSLGIALALASCAKSEEKKLQLGPPEPAVALAGLPNVAGRIAVTLETSEGPIHCELEPGAAPHAVALFVGLALGRASWLDTHSAAVVTRPMYRGTKIFRAVPDVFWQSGCPLGNGTGSPGYRLAVEASARDRARLTQPGTLLLAGYHAPPNRIDPHPPPPGELIGSQFVLGLGNLSHLAGEVSVLGTCVDLERARAIAALVSSHTRDVRVERVVIPGGDP
jgi:peptidyl-prolyl cis-trans isomerase A (cyclophilin A)